METKYIFFWIAWIMVFYLITVYNRLVSLRLNRENAFADIDVQLKQRHDLIPQLIDTVKWAKNFETEVLTRVTEARAKAMWAWSIDEKIQSEKMLWVAMSGLFAVAEAYPELKSNQNFLQLQTEIADIENKLASVRRFFNSATKELNQAVLQFPSNIVAWMFWFKNEDFFDIDENREEMEKAPKINFN